MAPLSFRKKNNLECDWNRRQMCRLKRACHSESSREGDARCSCCCCCRATKLTTFFCGGSHEMAASSSPRANPSFKAIGGKRTYYYIPLGVNDHQLFIDHLLYTFNIAPYITIYTYIYLSCYTRRIIRRLQTDRNDLYVEMHILSDCESLWCTARQSRLERSGDSQSRIQKERWCLFLSSLQAHPSCICRPCLMLFLILADQRDKWISFGFLSWMFWRGDAQKKKPKP